MHHIPLYGRVAWSSTYTWCTQKSRAADERQRVSDMPTVSVTWHDEDCTTHTTGTDTTKWPPTTWWLVKGPVDLNELYSSITFVVWGSSNNICSDGCCSLDSHPEVQRFSCYSIASFSLHTALYFSGIQKWWIAGFFRLCFLVLVVDLVERGRCVKLQYLIIGGAPRAHQWQIHALSCLS